jgi:hypothetical protein
MGLKTTEGCGTEYCSSSELQSAASTEQDVSAQFQVMALVARSEPRSSAFHQG